MCLSPISIPIPTWYPYLVLFFMNTFLGGWLQKYSIKKSWGTWSGWEVHGKRLTWKCHSFTQTGSCGHQRMRPEREYCYTYQRSVPYDRDTTSDARHREADRGIVRRLQLRVAKAALETRYTVLEGIHERIRADSASQTLLNVHPVKMTRLIHIVTRAGQKGSSTTLSRSKRESKTPSVMNIERVKKISRETARVRRVKTVITFLWSN